MEKIQDKIGRKIIINKINNLVESLPKSAHLCLALDGKWGSGKSFALQMLNEELSMHEEYLIVNYDAWKNNFYPDPLIAILYCVLDSVKEKFGYAKKFKSIAKKEIKKLAKEKLENHIQGIIDKLYKLGKSAAVGAFVVETLWNIIKCAQSSILDNKMFDEYKSYQSLLEESISLLNAITQFEEYEDKQTKLIILVDEIDRCLPEEQFKTLERLHHLFGVKNCAVIVAINKEQVAKVYNQNYGTDGGEYLRKFFDYEFHLEVFAEIYYVNWLQDEIVNNDEIEKVGAISKQQLKFLKDVAFKTITRSSQLVSVDNRIANRILKEIKSIAIRLPERKIDYPYLYLINYLICCKLYNKASFIQLLSKNEKLYLDLFASYPNNHPLLSVVINVHNFNGDTYKLYRDSIINTINFYINMWLFSENTYMENNVKTLFSGHIEADSECVNKLKLIFSLIDGISD